MEPQQTPNLTPQTPIVEVPTVAAPISAPLPIMSQPTTNHIWTKAINSVNYITLAICLGFLIIIDLPILLQSPSLATFFYAMLIAFGLFIACMLVELRTGKQLQNIPSSSLDTMIFVLAIVRNTIIVLNVIPFIQIIGFIAAPLALLFILANAIMISIRLRQRPTPAI